MYIEVDLENQYMWYYKDGKVVFEIDIVFGKLFIFIFVGVFYVWNKEEDVILKGINDDGIFYESLVNYWMLIDWIGVGIYDFDW